MTPKKCVEGLRVIVNNGLMQEPVVLCFIIAFVKCTSKNFTGANEAPCLLAYPKQCSWRLCRVLQLSSVILPKARAFTSPIKPILEANRAGGLQASTRIGL
jgi:hypothetical protein